MQIDFASNVDAVLARLKIDRAKAALMADITRHSLRIMLGYNAPTAKTVNKLAEALNVAPSMLIMGPGKRMKKYTKPLDVAGRVRQIMERRDMDAEDLAKLMQWDGRGNAHHFFKVNNPRIMRLPMMADLLGVELKELVK